MTAVRDAGTRQDTFVVRLTINGATFGVWDKKTGGELDSDATTYWPGNMRDQQDLGGRATAGNITLQRLYDLFDDHDRANIYLAGAGKAQCSVSQTPLDQDGNEHGKSIIWNGRLKRVLIPDVDSESSSAAMIEVEITVKGRPAAI